jgi:hypothetical protein
MRSLKNSVVVYLLFLSSLSHAALVQWYQLEEGAVDSTTNWTYSAVSSSVGTLGGSTLPNWVSSGLAAVPAPGTRAALYFNGNGVSPYKPYVLTDFGGIAGSGPRTIAAWIKPDTTQGSTSPTIVHWGPGGVNGGRVTFKLNNNSAGAGGWQIRLEVQGGGISGTKNVADGRWHHVAVVVPNGNSVGNARLYVDGVQDTLSGTGSQGLNTVTNASNCVIIGNAGTGTLGWDNTRYFNGYIDEVRIYDQALAAADLLTLVYGSGNAPTLSAPLADQSIVLGDAAARATFSVAAGGTPPLSYQWKCYGTNLPAQTNAVLVLDPAGPANVGPYSVTVSNVFGTVTGSASLRLNTGPLDPPQQVALVGGTARLSVAMPGNPAAYSYQWRKEGTNLPAATAASYTLAGAALADDSTNYTVVVTLGGISATSAPPATLRVLPTPASAYAARVLSDGPAGYWRLGETNGASLAADETTFNPGAYSNYLSGELGSTGALANDPDTASALGPDQNFVQVPYQAQLSRTNALTLEVWVNPWSTGAKQSLMSCLGNLPVVGYELYLSPAGNCVFATSQNTSSTTEHWDALDGGPVVLGVWTHLVAVLDNGTKRLYTNGVLAATQRANFFAASGVPIRLGANASSMPPGTFCYGALDEPAIYGKVLSAAAIQNHFLSGIFSPGVAPSLPMQPQSQTVVLGDTNAVVTFSVVGFGSPPLQFQWLRNGQPLNGQTDATLSLPAAGVSGQATYSVQVSNDAGSITSSNASLSYILPPVSPATEVVLEGAPAALALSLPAYQPYSYQWYHAGAAIPGATQATWTLPQAALADAGDYTVVATLGPDSVPSAPATLTVLALPSEPFNNVIASDRPLAWWRLDDPPGADFIAEANGLFPGTFYADVRLGVEGALLGDANTAAAFTGYSAGARTGQSRIDVNYAPDLNPAVFSIECWALVTGGSGTYRSPVTSRHSIYGYSAGYLFYAGDDDRWQFWLGTGADAFFTITGPPVVENQWSHLVGTYDGVNAAFYVNGTLVFSGPAPYVPNGQNRLCIGGGATENPAGNFYFPGRIDEVTLYTNALSLAQVQMHYAAAFPAVAAPRFLAQPLARATLSGQAYTLSVPVHSSPPVRYQWQFNGANLPGATNATLGLSSLKTANAGTYQLVATHGAASSLSAPAPLQVFNGEAVSVSFEGFEGYRTVAATAGQAGYVSLPNWNELGYNTSAGSATGLLNHLGQTNGVVLSWSAGTTRRWNGPFTVARGDAALLNGFLEADGPANITVTLDNIPLRYQTTGYSLYAYFGEPSASLGAVHPADSFGAVSLGAVTNYYHNRDLALWDGTFQPAVTTNPADLSPADANCVVFTNLNSASVTLVVAPHPSLSGPVSLSGLQLVANALAPATLTMLRMNGTLILTWPESWVLQQQTVLNGVPGAWSDVPNAGSPYTVPTALAQQQFFRLRSP